MLCAVSAASSDSYLRRGKQASVTCLVYYEPPHSSGVAMAPFVSLPPEGDMARMGPNLSRSTLEPAEMAARSLPGKFLFLI